MTEQRDREPETTTESRSNRENEELVSELDGIREKIDGYAATANDPQEEELYRILVLRLVETQRHLEAMDVAREPGSEFSFDEILDGMDEKLVSAGNGVRLEHRNKS